VRVRPARPEDAAAVAEVHVRTWQAAYEHVFGAEKLARIDTPERRGRWERWLAEGEHVWVAEEDDRVVGFVWIGDSRDDDAGGELFAIYVLPEAWGSGVGPGLMAVGADALRERYESSILWVLEDNPRAAVLRAGRVDAGRRTEGGRPAGRDGGGSAVPPLSRRQAAKRG
jgi:GNAT superfamily N-acetyltransferase